MCICVTFVFKMHAIDCKISACPVGHKTNNTGLDYCWTVNGTKLLLRVGEEGQGKGWTSHGSIG